jgi:hypothetical protein
MPRGGARKHIHKYRRLIRAELWACGEPTCTHYMPRNLEENMEGKFSKCWKCEFPFALDKRALKLERPLCLDCENKAKGIGDTDGLLRYIDDATKEAKLKNEKSIQENLPKSAADIINNITGSNNNSGDVKESKVEENKNNTPFDPFGDD